MVQFHRHIRPAANFTICTGVDQTANSRDQEATGTSRRRATKHIKFKIAETQARRSRGAEKQEAEGGK